MYQVKEIFYTLQGEGMNAGRPAVFCRFAGCNLWSGHEKDRAGAVCKFCDTDFVGTDGTLGGKYASADALADAIEREWPAGESARRLQLTRRSPLSIFYCSRWTGLTRRRTPSARSRTACGTRSGA